jgi:hypothetical protein
MTPSILAVALLSTFPSADYPLMHILRNIEKVKSYEGTLVQTGLIDGDDVSADVVFERPNRFHARVTAPSAWAGSTITYDQNTLLSHYPQLRFAIRFRNLRLPTGKDAERIVEYQYERDLKTYDYRIYGNSSVAGLPTVTLWHTARSKDTFDQRGWTKVYDTYSFPLAGELHFQGADYAYRWTSIRFNTKPDPDVFKDAIPEGTFISDWDLESPGIDRAAVDKEASFRVVLPDDIGLGLERTRIMRAPGPLPAYLARYQRDPHFLLVIEHPANGLSVPKYGLAVETGVSGGRLVLSPATSSYAFVQDGTYYTLFGDLPAEELLAIARRVAGHR